MKLMKLTAASHHEPELTGDKKRSPHEEHSLLTGVVDPVKLGIVMDNRRPRKRVVKRGVGTCRVIHSINRVNLSIFNRTGRYQSCSSST